MSEREILFRGKRVDSGEWIEGLPIKTYDTELGTEIGKNSADYSKPVPVVLMASGRIVLECGYDEVPFFNIDEYPIVNPETVGRYTGLTDKNGTRIFEGDVIKDDKHLYLIEWYAGDFDAGFLPFICSENCRAVRSCNCEIIGNIHDNPELLEGGIT